ncbi:MAG: acyl carrier protein [Marmoricola sp.]
MQASKPPGRGTSHEVQAGLAEIVGKVTGLEPGEVLPERRFVDDLRIDSLAMVEILEGAASHFGVHIEDEAAKTFVRVQDLAGYLSAGRS